VNPNYFPFQYPGRCYPPCPSPTNSDLDIVQGETWVREFIINRNGVLLGEAGWDAALQLYNPGDESMALYTSSVLNGKITWLQPGIVRVVIPAGALNYADNPTLTFCLTITNTDDVTLDPAGTTYIAIRGSMDVQLQSVITENGMRTF
jgi:hypothetical protein